jgi:PAS domain S-box-containing protein
MLMKALRDHINIAITRARLYTEARENEQKYRSVVENIDEVIFQLDKENRLTFLNPAWTEVTGYSMSETLGTNIALYVYPDDRPRHQDFIALDQMNSHESYRAGFRYVTQDGDTRWVEIRTRLLEDAKGQASNLFGSINDITERKRTDEERLRLSKLEEIGPLAGGIAHDFNNLLTCIVGHIAYAQLLITPDTSKEMAPRLDMAERATMEARKLTHQLLTFAKGGAPVKQITSVRTIIYEAAMFISSGSNVRCDFDIEENLWLCGTDSGQIGQVIQNLIINAQQAMPDGGVVTIIARNLSSLPDPALSLNPGP